VFHPHPRLTFSLLGVLLAASAIGCGGQGRDFIRIGDDVIGRGPPGWMDSVPGDLIFAGSETLLRGTVGGDYLVAAREQEIGGRVRGSVRAAGGEVHVRGVVDRNATVAGGNVSLDSAGVIEKNAYFAGGNVQITGTVRGALAAAGGNVTINGVVGRDVQVAGEELYIGPRAQIAGNLRYKVPPKHVRIDSAARISGTVTALPVESEWGIGRWLYLLGLLLVGVGVVALFPRFSAGAAEILSRRPVMAALVGVGWLILALFAIAILWFTVIGRPLAVLTLIAYMVLLFLADIPVAVWLGRRLLGIRESWRSRGIVVNYLVGGLVLLIVALIPVIGHPVLMIAGCFGVGMILVQAWTARRHQPA
jgi:cytoskeletal protein CcmA (bactofilin family)